MPNVIEVGKWYKTIYCGKVLIGLCVDIKGGQIALYIPGFDGHSGNGLGNKKIDPVMCKHEVMIGHIWFTCMEYLTEVERPGGEE